jgi:hypothetical protein
MTTPLRRPVNASVASAAFPQIDPGSAFASMMQPDLDKASRFNVKRTQVSVLKMVIIALGCLDRISATTHDAYRVGR